MQRRTALALAAGKIAVSAALLSYVVYRIEGNVFEGLAGLLRSPVVLAVVMLLWGIFLLGGVRWSFLTALAGARTRFPDAVSLNFIGHFFNQLLPTSFGGDVVRAWYARKSSLSLTQTGALVLADRIVGLLMLVMLIALFLPFVEPPSGSVSVRHHAWAVVTVCVLGTVVFFAAAPLFARYRGLSLFEWCAAFLRRLLRDPGAAASIGGVTLLGHVLSAIAGYLLTAALWPDAPVLQCAVFFLAGLLVSTVPISYAGWGVREASVVYFLSEAGVPAEAAFKASVMFGVLLAVASLPGALFWARRTGSASRPHK